MYITWMSGKLWVTCNADAKFKPKRLKGVNPGETLGWIRAPSPMKTALHLETNYTPIVPGAYTRIHASGLIFRLINDGYRPRSVRWGNGEVKEFPSAGSQPLPFDCLNLCWRSKPLATGDLPALAHGYLSAVPGCRESPLVSINATVYVGGYKRRCCAGIFYGEIGKKLNERYQRVPLRKFTNRGNTGEWRKKCCSSMRVHLLPSRNKVKRGDSMTNRGEAYWKKRGYYSKAPGEMRIYSIAGGSRADTAENEVFEKHSRTLCRAFSGRLEKVRKRSLIIWKAWMWTLWLCESVL